MTSWTAQPIRRTGALAVATLLGLLSGCGATPARSNVPPTPARPLSGEYVATFHTQFVGPIRARMIAEPTEQGFKANTPPGVAWGLVGGVEKLLGPLFTPFVFPSGMILTWESTLPRDGGHGQGTIGVGSIDSLRARTRIVAQDSPVEVRWRDGRLIGLLDLKPGPGPAPFADYAALAARAREEFPARYFDPVLARSRPVQNYLDDLAAVASKSHDDIEFLFGALFAGRKNIARYGTPMIFPREQPASRSMFAGKSEAPKPIAVSGDPQSQTVTLRIDAFMEDALVDEGFRKALATRPKALILDLRTCPGVELAAFRAATWLTDVPLRLGTYVGAAKRGSPDEGSAPVARICSESSSAALTDRLALEQALAFEALPRADGFSGPVVVLTSRRTSSTAEALTTALAAAGRVTIIGEPTAARPMLSREFDLGQDWSMRIAAYDYIRPDGTRVPRGGLDPAVRAIPEQAPQVAREWLARRESGVTTTAR
ncbi:hypothetical protein PHYC_01287 [Phycisphaerales bacterium]|nr:hypothetical protein PHYC_01287 [Phycisphaerales bacterium]